MLNMIPKDKMKCKLNKFKMFVKRTRVFLLGFSCTVSVLTIFVIIYSRNPFIRTRIISGVLVLYVIYMAIACVDILLECLNDRHKKPDNTNSKKKTKGDIDND